MKLQIGCGSFRAVVEALGGAWIRLRGRCARCRSIALISYLLSVILGDDQLGCGELLVGFTQVN